MARGLAVAVALVVMLTAAAPASAVDVSASCATLATALTNAADGTVITLNSSDGPGGLCNTQFTLHNFGDVPDGGTPAQWTLKGDPSNGVDGFDGTLAGGRVLTGNDVHRLLIQDLLFRDSDATGAGADGGAISIVGDSNLQVFNATFLNNTALDRGGAISFAPDLVSSAAMNGLSLQGNTFGSATEGNGAGTGGAVSIQSAGGGTKSIGSNTFRRNTAFSETNGAGDGGALVFTSTGGSDTVNLDANDFIDNTAAGSGGGASIADFASLNVNDNLFDSNILGVNDGGLDDPRDHLGGGLFVSGSTQVRQRGNDFTENAISAFPNGLDYGGGGEAIVGGGLNVTSKLDRWVNNVVPGQVGPTQLESTGGGLHFSGSASKFTGLLDDFAGNTVGSLGEGGGIYTGAFVGTILELHDTTVAGNTVGSGGEFAGIGGDANDGLVLRNSIVYTSGAGDVGGFGGVDAEYSDACKIAGGAFDGVGNICANPLLVNPSPGVADIHQTAASPTIDKGDDASFQDQLGEDPAEDYEGDDRPTDGDGDGHTVDMGADESPAFTAGPPPPGQTPQCSDGADNDGDGAIDGADPGCLPGPTDDNEGDETPGDLVLCGSRDISLVRADVKGKKVELSGFVATKFAGQKVALSVRYLGKGGKPKTLASVTAGADGAFRGRVAKPSRKLFNLARYRAQVGSAKSVELKLPQSLASSSLKQAAGGMLELRGQVDRAVLGKRNAIVVKRILCGKYTTVGQAKPNRKGGYVVRFPAPASGGSALYRAETKVLARPGSKRYVKQFARAIGITF